MIRAETNLQINETYQSDIFKVSAKIIALDILSTKFIDMHAGIL